MRQSVHIPSRGGKLAVALYALAAGTWGGEVYLKKGQRATALAGPPRARRAPARALEARQRRGARDDELASALKGLAAVQRAIERGAFDDAHRQLVALDKSLDRLNY